MLPRQDGHAAPRGPDPRPRRPVHLPARRAERRGLVGHAPADRARCRGVRGRCSWPRRRCSAASTTGSSRASRSPCRPQDDVEVRRLSLTNLGDRPREIEVTSYAELALAPTSRIWRTPLSASCSSRPLAAEQRGHPLRAPAAGGRRAGRWSRVHVLSMETQPHGPIEWETDRSRFIGRGRDLHDPDRPRRAAAQRHDRRGPRPDRERSACASGSRPAPSSASRSRPAVASDLAAATALAETYHDPGVGGAHVRARVHQHADGAPPSRHHGRGRATSSAASRRARSTLDPSLRAGAGVLQSQQARTAGALGPWHLGRPADPARGRRRTRRTSPFVAQVAEGTGVLAAQGPERGRRDPERARRSTTATRCSSSSRRWSRAARGRRGKARPGGVFVLRSDGMREEEVVLLKSAASRRAERPPRRPRGAVPHSRAASRRAPEPFVAVGARPRRRAARARAAVAPAQDRERPRRIQQRGRRLRRRARRRSGDAGPVGQRDRRTRPSEPS